MTESEWLGVEIALTCDCLGCLNDARREGALDEATYDAIFDALDAEQRMQTAVCPSCGDIGYVSQIQPDTMHCPSCGAYAFCERLTGEWAVYARGRVWDERQKAKEGA